MDIRRTKIGIVTYSKAYNMGAILQAYALQHFLDKYDGVEAYHLSFSSSNAPSASKIGRIFKKLLRIPARILGIRKYLRQKKNREVIDSFRYKHLKFASLDTSGDGIPDLCDFDAFITGSDQVWNTSINGRHPAFYLDFATNQRKLAYAASVGRKLTEEDKAMLIDRVKRFDAVSAREGDLNDFLVSIGVDSKVVLDPVFLLAKEEWKDLEVPVQTPDKYIFCYVMEDTDVLRKTLKHVSEKHGCQILYIVAGKDSKHRLPGERIFYYDPGNFLYLISHADAVVTNSFHASAFSAIFGKPLYMVAHSSRNSRLEQLANNLEFPNSIISEKDDISGMRPIEVTNQPPRFMELLERSRSFLLNSLELPK